MNEKKENTHRGKSQSRAKRSMHRALNSWSFFRLKQMITYKAEEVGILVTEVDPKYTSQRCPKCGINHNFRQNGKCRSLIETCPNCGLRWHHDLKGAYNICHSYVVKLHKNDNPEKDFATTRCKMLNEELKLCAVLKSGKTKPIFTRDDYNLIGWQSGKTGIIYGAEDTIIVIDNENLYAMWENV